LWVKVSLGLETIHIILCLFKTGENISSKLDLTCELVSEKCLVKRDEIFWSIASVTFSSRFCLKLARVLLISSEKTFLLPTYTNLFAEQTIHKKNTGL
jgi:hypothetical protein